MLIVRHVHEDDLDALFELIQRSEYGLTTLKIAKDALAARIENQRLRSNKKAPSPTVCRTCS